MEYLTEEELDRLLAQINTRYPTGQRNLALLRLLADTGLRISEALGIDTRDLESEGGQLTSVVVRHGKGGKRALLDTIRMPLTRQAAAKLGAWLKAKAELGIEGKPVFCTITEGNRGSRIKREYAWAVTKRLADRAGIEKNVSPHVFRHSFAMRLLQRGKSLAQLKAAMRHSRISTTIDIYGDHAQEELLEAAVSALNDEEEQQADEAQRALKALLALPQEQRQALAAALTP